VRRKAFGRDLGLSIRMALALLPIVGLYALAALIAIGTLLVAVADGDAGAILGWLFLALCFGVIFFVHVFRSDQLVLKSAGAKTLERGEEKEVEDLVRRTAASADMPPPRVALISSRAPNALAVGLRLKQATVALTTELVRRLTPKELEAVVAHELAHIANRDGAVMTFVSGPSVFGAAMRDDGGGRGWVFFYVFYWPVYVLGLMLMWAISRYREYTADRGSALITGAPEQLMSALQKIGEKEPRGDLRGGAAVSALCIVPAQRRKGRLGFLRRFEIFMDHPPLEKRLHRLGKVAGEMGRPVR
jgi:heat shock protein HtpX